jgi:hypothetical protein
MARVCRETESVTPKIREARPEMIADGCYVIENGYGGRGDVVRDRSRPDVDRALASDGGPVFDQFVFFRPA